MILKDSASLLNLWCRAASYHGSHASCRGSDLGRAQPLTCFANPPNLPNEGWDIQVAFDQMIEVAFDQPLQL